MEQVNQRLQTENILKKALDNKEFQLYYQPKLDLNSGGIIGVEALIRWEHSKKGIIPPIEFIPLAEKTEMILPIGEWVLRTACQQNKIWQDAGLPPMIMAVNLSARQFYQANLVEMVQQVLEETQLSPEYLEIEITESMMMDVKMALPIIKDLKSLGVRISLDDFGTGYSSLFYLKEFPIDIIKIDQCFVRNCTVDTKDATIVKTIIAMAHQLQLEVIAEGVESKDHLIFLQQNLCNKGQGYFLSQPLPAKEFEQEFCEIEQIIHREGIPQEISRQKWMEEALENARQELRETVRQQQGMIFKYKEQNGRFIHTLCDGELLYRIGLTPEELIGKELHDILPNEVADRKLKFYQRAWNGEENVTYEGSRNDVWYLASLRPIRKGGEVVEVVASCVDITERKESEERYRKVVEFSPKGIVIHREGTILYANPSALKMAMENDVVGKSIYTFIHPHYYGIAKQRIPKLQAGMELPITEMKLIRRDGELIDIENRAVSIHYDSSPSILVVFTDVTERKKTEQALEENKERYKRLLELSPEAILIQREGVIQYANPSSVKLLGAITLEDLVGKPVVGFSPPEYMELVEQRIRTLNRPGISVAPTEEKVIRLDGRVIDVEITGISLNDDGKLSSLMVIHDLTKRKQAEEAHRQSELKYRLITENTQDLIRMLNINCIVEYASPSHERVLGYPPKAYEGKSLFEMVYPDEIPHLKKLYAHIILSKTPCHAEFRMKHAQDGWVFVEAKGTPILNKEGQVESLVVVARDISERLNKHIRKITTEKANLYEVRDVKLNF